MAKLTKHQRAALKAIYDRGPDWWGPGYPATYRDFRKLVVPDFCGDAIMVPAGGMWLGIETDGYIHS